MNDYFHIGKIAGSHGLTGEVILEHALGKKSDLKGLQTIFIEDRKDSFIPYFIENGKGKNETETLLKLEGINTKESARRLNQKKVWLLKADFEKYAEKAAAISMLGFTIINNGTTLGQVEEVIEQPMQILCRITYQGNEAFIPIHQDTLKQIDQKKKEVHVSLPEGLLELYG